MIDRIFNPNLSDLTRSYLRNLGLPLTLNPSASRALMSFSTLVFSGSKLTVAAWLVVLIFTFNTPSTPFRIELTLCGLPPHPPHPGTYNSTILSAPKRTCLGAWSEAHDNRNKLKGKTKAKIFFLSITSSFHISSIVLSGDLSLSSTNQECCEPYRQVKRWIRIHCWMKAV